MAHLLDMTNGVANMAYAGATPWHNLGFQVNADDPLEVWAEKGGFNHELIKSPIQYDFNGESRTVPNRWAIVRSDTGSSLSVMSSNFQITQPKQVIEFFRDIVDAGDFKMETVGMLKGGATYWAMARVQDSFDVGMGDTVLPYLLLATSCDGSMSNVAMFTTVRVVCNNTLSMSVGENGANAQIRVPHSTAFNATKFKQELGLAAGGWERFKKDAVTMSKMKMSREDAVRFFMDTLYPKADHSEFDPEIKRPLLELVIDTYENGVGQHTKSAKGTLWGCVQGITRVIDHERPSASNDNRLQSAWFGTGSRTKNTAWQNALELMAA